jgi:hypothetical protein
MVGDIRQSKIIFLLELNLFRKLKTEEDNLALLDTKYNIACLNNYQDLEVKIRNKIVLS